MSTTQKSAGKILELTAPGGGVVTGLGYMIGSLFVVAITTAAATVRFNAATEGEFTLPKTSAQAWAEGDRIYWDVGNARADNVPTVGKLIGVATAVAANPTATGSVKLLGNVPDLNEGLQAAVADVATADADGTYGAPEASLINELKAQVNALLAILRIQGIITPP